MFDDDEAAPASTRLRAELRTELESLTARVDRATKNQIDFANQFESAEGGSGPPARPDRSADQRASKRAQKRQQDFYVDLDSRLRKLEAAARRRHQRRSQARHAAEGRSGAGNTRLRSSPGGLQGRASTRKPPPPSRPSSRAIRTAACCRTPTTGTVPASTSSSDFPRAADTFGKVAATWPNDPKAPDALLAQGNALAETGDAKGSKRIFDTLIGLYPAAPAAQIAKQRLKKK